VIFGPVEQGPERQPPLRYGPKFEVTVMPTHKAGSGYQWGKSGKVYTGKNAKAKADKQGRAIKASQARAGKQAR
jgi:hypothetical protein